MSFADAVKAALENWNNFSGRSRRSEFWYFYLALVLLVIASQIVLGVVGQISGTFSGLLGIVVGIVLLALCIPLIAAEIRRMHDTDHSGWWILVPIVNLVFAVTDGTVGDNRFGPSPKGNAGTVPPPPPL